MSEYIFFRFYNPPPHTHIGWIYWRSLNLVLTIHHYNLVRSSTLHPVSAQSTSMCPYKNVAYKFVLVSPELPRLSFSSYLDAR